MRKPVCASKNAPGGSAREKTDCPVAYSRSPAASRASSRHKTKTLAAWESAPQSPVLAQRNGASARGPLALAFAPHWPKVLLASSLPQS